MFVSEMIDTSNLVGAGDDDRVDFTFARGVKAAVISTCAVWVGGC
jgi:hypothetical protein